MERITASGDRSLRTRPSTRCDMNGSTMAIRPRAGQLGHGPGAGLHGGGGGRVVQVDAEQHLAAVEAHRGDGRRVVAGEPVVDLEGGAGQAAAVHRPDDHLVLERAEQQQVLEDVGGAEHAVHAGPGQRQRQPVQQVGPAGHGHRPVPTARSAPRAGWSAAMMISRPSSPSRDGRRGAGPAASAMACGRRARASRMARIWSRTGCLPWSASATAASAAVSPARSSVTSVGRRHGVRAVQPRGHDGPGGVGEAHHPLDVPAGQQPVAQRPAERVAGAEPVEHVDRHRRDLDGDLSSSGQDALGALLDDGQLDAELVQLPRGGLQRFPLPHRDVALLEVADGHGRVRQCLLDPVPACLAGRTRTSAGSPGPGR